jgi:PAS domain-containing protein
VRRRLIVEYVKKEGGRFFMKDEQGRYFQMNTQAVEQLELPVREFIAIRKWKFFLGEEVGKPPPW